jgi:hypothetical protein
MFCFSAQASSSSFVRRVSLRQQGKRKIQGEILCHTRFGQGQSRNGLMEHLSKDTQGASRWSNDGGASVGAGCAWTQAFVFAVLTMSLAPSGVLQRTMRDRRSYEVADTKSQIQGKTEQNRAGGCTSLIDQAHGD